MREHLTEVDEGRAVHRPRFARYGRLARYPGAPEAEQIRCECDRCGTHLMGHVRHDGKAEGACPVCLSRKVSPVEVHRATA